MKKDWRQKTTSELHRFASGQVLAAGYPRAVTMRLAQVELERRKREEVENEGLRSPDDQTAAVAETGDVG